MSCILKNAFGVEAPCEGCSCTYWRHADAKSGLPEGCALAHYALVGSYADTTTRWLYDYKIAVERTRLAAYLSGRTTHPHRPVAHRRASVAGAA